MARILREQGSVWFRRNTTPSYPDTQTHTYRTNYRTHDTIFCPEWKSNPSWVGFLSGTLTTGPKRQSDRNEMIMYLMSNILQFVFNFNIIKICKQEVETKQTKIIIPFINHTEILYQRRVPTQRPGLFRVLFAKRHKGKSLLDTFSD